MHFLPLDWAIVVVSLLVCLAPALWFARRGSRNTAEFFTSGRAAPWWLIGISMVATTFSTDTPNLVTDIVRRNGVAGNWAWWAFLLTGMTTVFIYARLWRRSGVLTDLEFYELRYSGRAASAVRGFRAVYLGLLFNCVTMAAVNLAAVKIAQVLLGWSPAKTLLICGALCVVFSAPAGLWGVLVVDLIQFGIALTGSFAAAYYALQQPQVGGLHGLVTKLAPSTLDFLPDFGNTDLVVTLLVIPLAVQWWSVWYPGAEPGGGSYIAQRMLAAKSERAALDGTLFFNAAHYALRPWPWIIVALASLLVYPQLADIRRAFPHVDPALINHDLAYPAMLRFLPAGFAGLMVAGLAAAYISTTITHLNWGASYLVHDCYRRFLRPGRTERHYIWIGRVATVALMVVSGLLTFQLQSAKLTFDLLLSIGAGTGLLYLLRWFWWRVNAWAEIAAMAGSFALAVGFFIARRHGLDWPAHDALLASIAITTVIWVVVAYVAPGTDPATLQKFYALVRPAGPGWRRIREQTGLPASTDNLPAGLLSVALGATMIWSALFAAGSLLYGQVARGWGLGSLATAAAIALWRLRRAPSHAVDSPRNATEKSFNHIPTGGSAAGTPGATGQDHGDKDQP
ncbi:MAG TPA: sodium:solute symporter family protein [Opitutus sp.]|nr:sodium:solute symporter family protein [Opitutus sp.]